MSIGADELKKELIEHRITQCQCCGSPVIVSGEITKFYIPVDIEILKEMGFKYEKK